MPHAQSDAVWSLRTIILLCKSLRGSSPRLFSHPSIISPPTTPTPTPPTSIPKLLWTDLLSSSWPPVLLRLHLSACPNNKPSNSRLNSRLLRFLSPRLASDTYLVVILALPRSPSVLPHCFRFVQYLPLRERSSTSLAWFEKSERETGIFSSPDSFCTAHFVSAEENCFTLILLFTQFFTFFFFSLRLVTCQAPGLYCSAHIIICFPKSKENFDEKKKKEKREKFYQVKGSCWVFDGTLKISSSQQF